MTYSFETDLGPYAGIMAESLKGVADELRVLDPIDLISFIRFGSYATLEDLLQSSTELFFQHGALSFGWTAGVDMAWGELPTVILGMEFRHRAVSVFFDLCLRACDESVRIGAVLFEQPVAGGDEKVRQLREAIAEARVPERSLCKVQKPRKAE